MGPQLAVVGRHHHFCTAFNKFQPASGPLQTGPLEEAGLRGRADPAMLRLVLPPPAATTRIVVSGPPQMFQDMRLACLSLGYDEASLIELEAEANTRPSASPSAGDGAVVPAEDDGGNDTDSSGGVVVA